MARFEFRLKALLAVREAARDEQHVRLAEAQAEDRKLKDRRAVLERELASQQEMVRSGASLGRLDIDRLMTADRYDLVIRRELLALLEHELTWAAEIERRRQTLVAADREVRVLEKLRERQQEQFRQQQALAETKQLDEVASRMTANGESGR